MILFVWMPENAHYVPLVVPKFVCWLNMTIFDSFFFLFDENGTPYLTFNSDCNQLETSCPWARFLTQCIMIWGFKRSMYDLNKTSTFLVLTIKVCFHEKQKKNKLIQKPQLLSCQCYGSFQMFSFLVRISESKNYSFEKWCLFWLKQAFTSMTAPI